MTFGPQHRRPRSLHQGCEVPPFAASIRQGHAVFGHCRQVALFKSRTRPFDDQFLCAAGPLKIVDSNGSSSLLQDNLRHLRLPSSVDSVVQQDFLAVDRQPRSVIGIDDKRVFAVGRDFKCPDENEAEREFSRGGGNVKVRPFELRNGFWFEGIEVRKLLPCVTVEPVFQIIHVRVIQVLILLRQSITKFLFNDRDLGLRRVQFFAMFPDCRFKGGLACIVFKKGPLDLWVRVSVRGHTLEKCQHAVVVGLRDRIDFVIVTSRTVDRQSQERLARGGDDVIESVVQGQQPVGRLVIPLAQPINSGRNESVGRGLGQFVTRQLFAHELVIRFVSVKCANHIIPVSPGIGLHAVPFKAVRIRIADDIEPVACPLFAVAFRLQQAIDNRFVGVGRGVGEKRFDFGWRRRKPGQVIGNSTKESCFACRGCWCQPVLFELAEYKRVDRIGDPACILDGRWLCDRRWHEGPVFLPFRPLFNPALQQIQLRGRQAWTFRGHLLGFVGRQNAANQFAMLDVFRNHGALARLELFKRQRSLIQSQSPFRLVRAVAGVAAFGENRLNLSPELDGLIRLSGRRVGYQHQGCDQAKGQSSHLCRSLLGMTLP